MFRALAANKHKVELVPGHLGIRDSFVVLAPLALKITTAREGGVLDALGVHDELLFSRCEIGAVNAVVDLASFNCFLVPRAQGALKLKAVVDLPGLEHVVALLAETHPFEGGLVVVLSLNFGLEFRHLIIINQF